MTLPTVEDVELITFRKIGDKWQWIDVFQVGDGFHVPIVRVFCIQAVERCRRGQHAHRQCSQIMVALEGEVHLACSDGVRQREVVLTESSTGVKVPPGIWVTVDFAGARTILMVLCDRPYDEADYMRSWQEFLSWRAAGQSAADLIEG